MTVPSVASLGITVAFNVTDSPSPSVILVRLSVIDSTGAITVTMHEVTLLPALAVMVVLPPPIAVTLPFESTAAM